MMDLEIDPDLGHIPPFKQMSEIDRNARAYGFEVGRGKPLTKTMTFSDDNPFIDRNWRDKVKDES